MQGAAMKKHPSWNSVVCLVLIVLSSACSSPEAIGAPTQLDQKSLMKAKLDQLVTVKDISSFSKDLGIVQWEMEDELVGEYRVCRTFRGQSWSVNRNLAANCIWQMNPGSTLQDTVDWLISGKSLPPDAKILSSAFDYDDDFALYAWLGSNGHSVYDGILLKQGYFYWAEVDIGTPGGLSPETLFTSKYGKPVDDFLHDVLMANLARQD
jgi:hypothetical protein